MIDPKITVISTGEAAVPPAIVLFFRDTLDPILLTLTAIGGLVYLGFRIRTARLTNKKLRLELQELEKEQADK